MRHPDCAVRGQQEFGLTADSGKTGLRIGHVGADEFIKCAPPGRIRAAQQIIAVAIAKPAAQPVHRITDHGDRFKLRLFGDVHHRLQNAFVALHGGMFQNRRFT